MTETSLPPANAPERPNSAAKKHRDWHDITSLAVLVFTLLAAAAAAGFTARQAYLANKQLKAARDTVNVAKDQEIRQLRAYIMIDPRGVVMIGRMALQVTAFANDIGQTPASKTRYLYRADIFSYPLPENFVFPALNERDEEYFGSSIISNTSKDSILIRANVKAIRPAEQWDHILFVPKGERLFVWGRFRYADIFNVERRTWFCHSLLKINDAFQIVSGMRIHPGTSEPLRW